MKCYNCNQELPAHAKLCAHCESPVMEIHPEEEEAVRHMLGQMPPDVLAEFTNLARQSASAEDFINQIFVGSCPKCGSDDTGDCEEDPEFENILLGRCYQCGQLWCTECERLLERSAPECPCLDEEEEEEDDDDPGDWP